MVLLESAATNQPAKVVPYLLALSESPVLECYVRLLYTYMTATMSVPIP